MGDIDSILTVLTIAAGAALGVERSLEFLKVIVERGYGAINDHSPKINLDRARRLNQDAQAALDANAASTSTSDSGLDNKDAGEAARFSFDTRAVSWAQLIDDENDSEASERFEPPALPILPATPYSEADSAKRLFYQVTGAALGILFAQLLGLRFISLFLNYDSSVLISFFDTLFSGVVVGGGSQPIHVLIRFINERRVSDERTLKAVGKSPLDNPLVFPQLNATGKPLRKAIMANALVEPSIEPAGPLAPIVYAGGLNIEALESRHIRNAPVNLVVYHHTAASSNASFKHIVDELTVKKGWLTGYHCVVMPDGKLKFMCRWDRYGSHAKGKNMRSLGLAFQGNFHSSPGDRFSNADGRFGNQMPTDAQLNAGARLIALWVHLYPELMVDFDTMIVPHRDVLKGHTVCPGSNFPHAKLEEKVREFYEFWTSDAGAKSQLEVFKSSTPYVYAEVESP